MSAGTIKLYLLVSFMTLVWGANYVVAKLTLDHFPPLVFAPLRTFGAAVLLAPVYLLTRRRAPEPHTPWTAKETVQLAFIGIAGIALNQLAFILGIGKTSVAHAALIIATTPVQVLLLAASRGMEALTVRKGFGFALAVLGIGVLNAAPGREGRGATLVGDLLIFSAALFFAIFTVGSKEATRRHGPMMVNAAGFAFGSAASIPLILYSGRTFDWAGVPAVGWLLLAYMAVFPSVICYFIYAYALERLPASRVSAFSYGQPLIAAFSAWMVLNEPVTAGVGVATALVLGGVWLAGRG